MTTPSHVPIKNTDMIREMKSKAVLNTNRAELSQYRQKRAKLLSEQEEKARLLQRIERLEKIVEELQKNRL